MKQVLLEGLLRPLEIIILGHHLKNIIVERDGLVGFDL
jgi:hypothetical protein